MHMRYPRLVLLVSISLAAGCAGSKDTVLPQDGPSMQAIYEAHFVRMGVADAHTLREALGLVGELPQSARRRVA